MRRTFSIALMGGVALSLSCSGDSSDSGGGFPEVTGWSQMGEITTYDAENLWEYINGAAELFVEYGVQTCQTVDLSSGDLTVTVDLYDMGSPLNAFGVYERESSGQVLPMEGAMAAVVSPPYQALLVKGGAYVKVNVFEGELTEATGLELLAGIAEDLAGDTSLPSELGLLPSTGKIADSEGYKAQAFMGMTELTDCIHARYAGEGEEPWQGFVVVPGAADRVWNGLAESWEALEVEGATVLFAEIPYRGLVGVIRTDGGVFGVSGASDPEALLARLNGFIG